MFPFREKGRSGMKGIIPGQIISHYKVANKLGSGGMGEVYKAEDTKLKRMVALKFLPPVYSGDEELKTRFINEAQSASALDHPNICTIYEVGETEEGLLFISMALYEGKTLKEKIEKGKIELEGAIDIAQQICRGLEKAHTNGIIHRDIKPANIFITNDGVVKILDFGLAKLSNQTKLTRAGTIVGTVAYMSPEQALGEKVDQRADIWSFGIVLYEMLTGKIPFASEYDQAVIYSILNEEPQFDKITSDNIPANLIIMLRKLLEKKPNNRYQTIGEFISELNQVKDEFYEKPSTLLKIKRTNTENIIRKIESIAVLPLENLSNDKEQEYFVYGMHDELLTDLSKIKALKVISRTSVMRYKNTKKTASEIAKELNVDALIEGSVLKVGESVRINIQLVDGRTDKHLWAEGYDRDLKNILTMLREVAQAIAKEIAINITQQEKNQFHVPCPINPEVQLEYFKGRYSFYQFNYQGFQNALAHFKRAIEIESNFAVAYAGQASVYFLLGFLGFEPYPELFPLSRLLAMKAINLDDELAQAHTILGWIKLCYDWDWQDARKEFERALELDPNNAIARHGYGDYLTIMGYPDEGLKQINLGKSYDPFSPIAIIPSVYHLIFLHRYDEIIDECKNLLEKYPNMSGLRDSLRDALWLTGSYEESYNEFLKIWAEDDILKEALEQGYKIAGPRGAVKKLANALVNTFKPYTGTSLTIASLYALINEKGATLEWLEKACQEHAPFLVHLKAHPVFDFIRSDPQFINIIQTIGFPESIKV
jgi:serine/threonine protein kinase